MSFLDLLFNGQPPPQVSTESNSTGSMPLWYASYLSSLANAGASIATQPYEAYPGARIAPPDTQQKQAYNYMGDNARNWESPLQQAQYDASKVSGGFNGGEFGKYVSPYIGGVVNEIGRLGTQNLNENLLPTLNSQFIGTGGFGSSRNMEMDERLLRDTGANISGQQGMALQGAFSSAMDKYLQGQQTANQGAQNLGGLAQTQSQLTAGTAGALAASGQTAQQFGQQNLDLAYSDFQNQLNYPRQNVSFLSSILRGTQVPTSQDTTNTAPFSGSMSPSPLATFGGLALAGLGANQPTVRARGGYVSGYARGGKVVPMRKPRGGLELAGARPAGLPAVRGGLDLMAA